MKHKTGSAPRPEPLFRSRKRQQCPASGVLLGRLFQFISTDLGMHFCAFPFKYSSKTFVEKSQCALSSESSAVRGCSAAPREISCARAANFYGFNKLMYNGISVEYLPVKARTSHNTEQSLLSVQREEKLPSNWHTGRRSTQHLSAKTVLCFKNYVFSCVVLFPLWMR